ncbi:MAG TPA: TonB-dependent receptor [Bryobacterales bacterium]|jgi:hypothetical protein|nr:TonB-dependent receptor [Bryobacterales bacterium]
MVHPGRLKYGALLLALAVFACVSPSSLSAQTLKGTILGTITDASHAVIPGVQVNITETNTNFHRVETTNESGFYAFANLDPGNYRVEVEQPGFRKVVRSDIELAANTTVRVDLELQPGQVTEVVDVTAEAPVLQTDRADTGGKIESQQLANLPLLNNRNYQNTLMLVPGVQRSYRSNSPFFNSQEHLQSVVNGLDEKNNYMIEGIDNNIEGYMTAVVLPADAIATVDVSTTNYDPELGRAGGAVVNVIMKSGTNDFHGSLFEYHRDSDLQARNVFATTVPHGVYNQFGGSGGGHIIRDKLFFFGDYQGSREIVGQNAIPTIPTMPMRGGDFSASPTTIYDPNTGDSSGRGRTPFPNNQIPANRISPIAAQYLSFLPPPTTPGLSNNYQGPNSQNKAIDQFDTKIDYVIGANDRMFFRYSFQRAFVTNPGLYGPGLGIYGGPSNNGFDATGPSRNQSPGLNYSHIFSPTLVMEARFGIVRNRNDATNVDTGLPLSQKLGIPNGNLGDFWTSGLAEVFVNGYDTPMIGINGCLPWRRAVTNFDFVNNWTKTKGTHVVKWGFDLRRERRDLLQTATFSPRGRFTFTPGPTALNGGPASGQFNAFAAFLLDQPNSVGRDLAVVFPTQRDWVYNLYFQDKWQVTRKLTLDLGLRWEYWPAGTSAFPGGASNYIPANNTLQLNGLGNIPMDSGIDNHPLGFGPRFGVAYRLDEKTVLRGGFGISQFYRYTTSSLWQYPVKQNQQLVAPNSFVAAGSMATGFPAPIPAVIPSNGIITNPPNQTFTALPKNVPVPYVESWNIAVQRSLPANLALDVAFVGNHGVHIGPPTGNSININASRIPGSGTAGEPLNILFGRTAATNVPDFESTFYDALQIKLNRRFSNGFTMTTSYAFGKSIDYLAGSSGLNNLDIKRNKGLADWDRRHIFTYSGTYDLPFGQGKKWATSGPAKWALGGWQVTGLWTWESGLPLDIITSSTSLNAPGLTNRPNQVAPVKILGNVGPGQYWFTASSFANPPALTFGNVGRNILNGPRLFNIDFSLLRRFRITERVHMEFTASAFNLSNTPWFDRPDTNLQDAAFGQVTTAQGNQAVKVNMNRSMQGSLRLTF